MMAPGKTFFRGVCPVLTLAIAWVGYGTAGQAQHVQSRVHGNRTGRPAPEHLSDDADPDEEPGMSAGRLIDSLFNPSAPESPVPALISQALGRPPYRGAARRSNLRGRLVRNPDTDNGSAPFVLVDRYGGIQRYIEPVSDIDLQSHEGEIVRVRRDTGDTLLASQLELPRASGKGQGIQLAGHEEPIPAGEPIPEPAGENIDLEGPLVVPEGIDPVYLDDDGIGLGGCPSCGGLALHQPGCGQAIRDGRNRFYAQGEYLLWALDGADIPPLVVQGEDDGDGNFTNAQVIYGNNDILTQGRSGARVRLGVWLGGGPWALEGEYLGLGRISSQFNAGGDGVTPPFIGRPFIDATTGLNAVEDVSFPGIQGNVTVDSNSEFQSGGIWLRHSVCAIAACQQSCSDDVTCDSCVDCGSGVGSGTGLCRRWFSRLGGLFSNGSRRMDFVFGLRLARLQENLGISENLQTTEVLPTTFQVNDQFSTTNEFTGAEIGYLWQWQKQRWSLDLQTKLALGNTQQQVDIHGSTVQDQGNGPQNAAGGLLALPSNIGSYERNEFSVIPQIGATLGFAVTRRLRLTAGYTFLYWSRVVRPGDQIDLEVNPGQLPFADVPSTIPARPQFVFLDTDIWAQGLNIGADYRW